MTKLELLLEKLGVQVLQTTYKSVTLTKAAATAAGLYPSASADLNTSYHICDGICYTQITDGGLTEYDVAITNNNGKVHEPVPIAAVGVGRADGSAPNERFLDVLFDSNSGPKAILEVTTFAATASELKVKVTFRLRKLSRKIELPSQA